MVTVLNYLWLGGRDSERHRPSRRELTKSQKVAVDHLLERAHDLGEVEKACPDMATGRAQLVEAKFDYAGEPVMSLEELSAAKVIPVWPAIGEAAVQPVVDYLPEGLRAQIEDPLGCLLPSDEWPKRPPRSKVRATQEEWNLIVKAAAARGLMVAVEEEEVFRDHNGEMVLNGAAAVKKLKRVGGEVKTLQRFISNFIPINSYQRHLQGGDRHLPYLGQLTLLEQDGDEVWITDSEDFTSCFNLWRLPSSWHRFMAFGMAVDGAIFGKAPGTKVFPAMSVVPMGWVNAVAEQMLCGVEEPLDVQQLREIFWSVLESLDAEQKRRFVVFVSACGRRPPEGWQHFELQVQRNGDGDDRLPTAYTCFTLLLLPRYSSGEVLRERLLAAITETEGFGRAIDEAAVFSPGPDFVETARAPHARFQLHYDSVLAKVAGHAAADFVVFAEAQGTGDQAMLLHNTRIQPEWLVELAPHYFKQIRAGEASMDL
eukprot:s828_g18.t1